MALIVEDGTGSDPNANSYVTEQQIIDFAALRGVTITPAEAVPAGIAAMDYLFSIDDTLQGEPTQPGVQPLPYPKTGIDAGCTGGDPLPDDKIPANIIQAQLFLSVYSFEGMALAAPVTGATVKKEKVDVIETEYATPAEGGNTNARPSMPTVEALLAPVSVGCVWGGQVSGFTTVRV